MSPLANGFHKSPELSIVNEDRRILPGPQLLHELVSTTPEEGLLLDFLEVDDSRVQLTYGDFHRLTDVLSQSIREQVPSTPNDRRIIPVIVPQCPELYIAWVAVLKAGAGFCPVSHDVPPERLKFIVKDVEASFVLTTSTTLNAFQAVLSDVKSMVVSLKGLQARLRSSKERDSQPRHLPDIDPRGPAYVMYTSGSTGLPKGVMVSHLSVSQSLLAHDEHVPRFKRFLQFASPTFDVSIFEIFFPFYRGATLVGCARERMLSDLPATIQTLNADAAELTPTVAGTLLRTRKAAPCLKTLLTIGEMLTTQVVSEFGGSLERPSMLYAMYGPTEAAIHCTLATQLAADASVRSIGRPFTTVTAVVLKESDSVEIAPIGESGELAIAGQLADGYLNRPDQNEQVFVELSGYGSIYRTGDRAICRPNGELEILGRMASGQVKLRGQRVELGEIEEVASKTPGVQLAIASVIDDILVLFCSASAEVHNVDVMAKCKSWLPPYMRPGEIVMLEGDVPRLPSGKVDRKALEHNYRESRSSATPGDDFQNDSERDIALTLETELGAKVGRTTSLWSLGLDSLRAIKIAFRLRQKYRFISAALVAEADSVAELATLAARSTQSEQIREAEARYETSSEWQEIKGNLSQDTAIAKLQPRWENVLPCSSMQIAMLVETMRNDVHNFNEVWLRLSSEVKMNDLHRAFGAVAKHNEILRSGFISTGQADMPFAQAVWEDLAETDLDLLHPLQLTGPVSNDEKDVLIRIHHALYDGWSWDLILDDLNALLSGRDLPNRTQYSEFRSYQQSIFLSETASHLQYWRDQFHDFKPSAFPNLSSSRSDTQSRGSIELLLSTSYDQVSEFALSLRSSRETIFEAAWSLLLSAYVNDLDVAIGVVFAGRHVPLPGVESVIGPCLSTFPLRVDMNTLRTAHDLINHIQRQRTQCLRHGSITLRDINGAADNPPGTKLFDTLCVWQEDSGGSGRDRSKVATVRTRDALDYAVVLEFEPRDRQICLKLTFDTMLIPKSHAQLLASQLDDATIQIMNNLEMRLDRFWETSVTEILSVSNAEYEEFNEEFDLTTSVANLAESDPERLAVEFIHDFEQGTGRVNKETLTYGDLFKRASAASSALRNIYGVRLDDLVCLIAPRSIQLYVGILGAIMAGAGYICVDPRTPAERVRHILSESKCKLVLTAEGCDSLIGTGGAQQYVAIIDLLQHRTMSGVQHLPKPTRDELAYAIFTSGSTGIPKGVLLTRRNLLSNLEHLSRLYPCEPRTDRLLQACSPAFDVSVFEIFWTWHVGMTLCTASNDVIFRDLERFVEEMNITHLSMTPSVAALVHPANVPHVKMLVTAGEPMNSKVFADWAGHGLYQGYGPSETTNICNVRPKVSKLDASNNVGPALLNTSIFVCRRQESSPAIANESPSEHPLEFRMLPKGAVGEIWIGGEQVGRGYIDPTLTARSFFNHPQYGRLYRSGDIGRLLADDSLVIMGREDDQVKLRGQRVELGEITTSLVKCDDVEDAVSMIINEGDEGTRLVSFWTPRQPGNTTSLAAANMTLFQELRNSLPSYMIPDALLRVDRIPLTRQGKIDRSTMITVYQTLDAEQLQAASRDNDSSGDLNGLSESDLLVAQVLSDVLGVRLEVINRNSSFYALGLDSINAIRVARSLRQHFPTVEISSLLRNPSIAQLTTALKTEGQDHPRAYPRSNLDCAFDDNWKAKVRRRYSRAGLEVEKFLPCTPLQESMATSSMNSSSRAYQNMLRFKVHGNLSTLRQAWVHALSRHQILRTGFVSTDSAEAPFLQAVLRNIPLPWMQGDNKEYVKQDLDPLMRPPWTLRIRQQEMNHWELALEIHHCLYDAEAMSILLGEVQASYHGQELPPSIAFDDYLSFMVAAKPEDTAQFWLKTLSGTSSCRLSEIIMSEDKIASDTNSMTIREATLSLSELQDAVRKISSTPLGLLQTAWSRVLFCAFQRQDICFGNVFSGRNLPIDGVDRIVAPCFNTIPIRAQLHRGDSNRELCRSIQQMNIELLPYQPSSLRRIQRQIGAHSRSLFDTLLLLQQKEMQLDSQIWSLIEESGDMSFPFILEIVLDSETDLISLKLHSEVANKSVSEQLLESFDSLLVHTARFPQARALDFSCVTTKLPKLKLPEDPTPSTGAAIENEVNGASGLKEELSKTEKIVKEVLLHLKPGNSASVLKDTTIFRLGFDSINAVQIAAKLRKHGFSISSADIMEAGTVRHIARLCDTIGEEHKEPLLFDLKAYEEKHRKSICRNNNIDEMRVQCVRPCTPTQSGILSQFLRSNRKLYFNSMRFDLENEVDLSTLKDSWSITQEMHEMLRTGFVETEDLKTPFAMITYHSNATPLPWIDERASSCCNKGTRDLCDMQSLIEPPWQIQLTEVDSSISLEISMLHALYDAYSLEKVLGDVASIYRGIQPTIPVAPSSVVSKILALSRDEASKTFWSDVSTDMCSTRFPDMRVYSPEDENFCVVNKRCDLSNTALETLCSHVGATMQAVVATAWSTILSAYTAQDQVTFGIILSGRDFEEEENAVVFPCINTVPFATEVSQDLAQVLRHTIKRCAGLMRHQHTPLSTIKRWIGVEDDLFDTVIVLQKNSSGNGVRRPWTLSKNVSTAEYAVSLEILPGEGDVVDFQLIFREDTVPPGQATYILREFEEVMKSILEFKPNDTMVGERSILSVVPAKDARIDSPISFLHEFEELTAKRNPQKSALEFVMSLNGGTPNKQNWTYSQLDSKGNQIARLIQSKGAKVGDLVAVCFDKCPEASFAILGIQKAGCGFIAIDPGAPNARKEFILRDSGCNIVLTTDDKTSDFSSFQNLTVLRLDTFKWQNLPDEKPVLSRKLDPQDTCYCLYTSGTTGTPKGCLISHDSAVQAMLSFQRIFKGRWSESSRWLQFASLHFDVSVLEQYWSWSVGICVTSAPRDLLFEDLPGTISALKITHLDLTPSLARLLTPEDVPSLCEGVFIVGGEQVSQNILEAWGDAQCLYNFYGPSEVTIGCTVHRQVPKNAKPTNIGQQWDNVGSFVLEPNSQKPVLRGAIGELCLSGPLVGKGYLNRPDLTAEKFVILAEYNARVYRTGDLVRLLHDNSFEFLGRIDDQVKLRGQRLEIGEINHVAMSAAPAIKDVATMVLKHPSQQKDQLVTFFSTAQRRSKIERPSVMNTKESKELVGRLQQKCSDRLPAYMVPTHFLATSSLPLTVNNKVDLKALKALYERNSIEAGKMTSRGKDAPDAEPAIVDQEMVIVLATFLEVPASSIKPNARLFELGLDSISAIGLSRALKRQGFRNSNVADILRHSVVQDLARVISRESPSDQSQVIENARKRIQSFADTNYEGVTRTLRVRKQDVEFIGPCTPLQEGMISKVMQSEPEDTVYFSCFRFELNPAIDIGRLKEAWDRTQQSVSILRTYFVSTADGFAQVVLRALASGVTLKTLENGRKEAYALSESSFKHWVTSIKSLSSSLPWSVDLIIFGKRAFMKLQIFHGLYDGNSLPLLLKQVMRHYEHPQETHQASLQFYEILPHGPLCQRPGEKEFWSSQLSSFKPFRLPSVHQEGKDNGGPIVLRDYIFPKDLQNLCNKLNVTTSAFFQGSLLHVLHKVFNRIPVLGVVVAGRALAHDKSEEVIGPMFNTIPFAISHLEKGSTIADLIQACHQFNVGVLDYQHTALRRIAKYIGQDVTSGLFDILFVFQKVVVTLEDDEVWKELPTESLPDYPLNVEVEQNEGSFTVTVVAKPGYLNEQVAKHLLETYLKVVQSPEVMQSILSDDFCRTQTNQTAKELHKTPHSELKRLPSEDSSTELSDTEIAIRFQVSELAAVEQDAIHLHGPTIFELGLDSIEAMKLAARLKRNGLKVAVSSIMRSPTIAGIAQAVSLDVEAQAGSGQDEEVQPSIAEMQAKYGKMLEDQGVDLQNVQQILPVTPMQEGLLAELHKYLNVIVFKLQPKIDIDCLIGAWERVIRGQPILRTRFAAVEAAEYSADFVQYISGQGNKVELMRDREVRDVVGSLREIAAGQELSDQTVRTVVVINQMAESFLLLAMPHALYDAWSLYLLHQQVARVYASPNREETDATPITYADHLEEVISRSQSHESRQFWINQLSSVQPSIFKAGVEIQDDLTLPLLLRESSEVSLREALKFCREQSVTLQSLGLACWTIALAYYTRQIDVCFGLVLSGRTTEDSDRLVFPTFNTVVFRPMIQEGSTIAQALKRVHDASVQVSEYQHFPLREAVRIGREQGATTELFNTLFTFQKLPSSEDDLPLLYSETNAEETSINPPYPINIEMESQTDGLVWTVAFQEGQGDTAFGHKILRDLDRILLAIIDSPAQALLLQDASGTSICGLPSIILPSTKEVKGENDSKRDRDELNSQIQDNWTSTETTIRAVLARVSRLDKELIGRGTGFFHMGLDSVSAIKVASLLRKEGIKLPVSEIIRAQTIEKMASAAQDLQADNHKAGTVVDGSAHAESISQLTQSKIVIPEDDVEAVMSCTAGQTYMLDMWNATHGRLFYPMFSLQVSGASINNVQMAMDKLVQKIPILRTAFVHIYRDGKPSTMQVVLRAEVAPQYKLPWSIRLEQFKTGVLVTLHIHHALYDAVSLQLLVTEVERLCSDVNSQTQLNANMNDFVTKTQPNRTAKEFWTSYLNPSHNFQPIISRGSFEANRLEEFNPQVLQVDDVSRQLRKCGLSIQALFFAVYASVYSSIPRQSNRDEEPTSPTDVIIGIYLSNRSVDIDGLTELVAPTFNIVPLRVRFGQRSLLETALQVQRDLSHITMAENCGVSMRDIHAWTNVKIDTFVNFLSLPDDDQAEIWETVGGSEKVKVTHVNLDAQQKERLNEVDTSALFFNDVTEQEKMEKWCLVSPLKRPA